MHVLHHEPNSFSCHHSVGQSCHHEPQEPSESQHNFLAVSGVLSQHPQQHVPPNITDALPQLGGRHFVDIQWHPAAHAHWKPSLQRKFLAVFKVTPFPTLWYWNQGKSLNSRYFFNPCSISTSIRLQTYFSAAAGMDFPCTKSASFNGSMDHLFDCRNDLSLAWMAGSLRREKPSHVSHEMTQVIHTLSPISWPNNAQVCHPILWQTLGFQQLFQMPPCVFFHCGEPCAGVIGWNKLNMLGDCFSLQWKHLSSWMWSASQSWAVPSPIPSASQAFTSFLQHELGSCGGISCKQQALKSKKMGCYQKPPPSHGCGTLAGKVIWTWFSFFNDTTHLFLTSASISAFSRACQCFLCIFSACPLYPNPWFCSAFFQSIVVSFTVLIFSYGVSSNSWSKLILCSISLHRLSTRSSPSSSSNSSLLDSFSHSVSSKSKSLSSEMMRWWLWCHVWDKDPVFQKLHIW